MTTFNDVWRKLGANKEYRSAFARAQFKRLVPFQIRALRKNRHMSQEELAQKANVTQGVISRAENSDYGNLTVNTILKVADGFDCAFLGRFVPFSELDDWFLNLSEDAVQAPSFDDEDRLFRLGQLRRGRRVSPRRHKRRAVAQLIRFDTREAVTLYTPLRPAAGVTQLSLQLDLHVGSGAAPQLVNSPPVPQGGAAISNAIQNAPPKAMAGGLR